MSCAILHQENPPRTLDSANPVQLADLNDYPLPTFPLATEQRPPEDVPRAGRVDFPDVAGDLGIQFTYFDSAVAAQREIMLHETIGGGVAVLDYDADGWPDLFFTQCGQWPPDPAQTRHFDRLYRNLGDGSFRDVTVEAGLDEYGYSQGVAAGDFNNDGFADLYVGNIGQNQLFRNNGDGTFSRVPHHQDQRPLIWTASCMIADINHDSLPDIYDVNYLTGDELYTKHCIEGDRLRSCPPNNFPGEQDFLYLNLGDGRWQNISSESQLDRFAGKGLGIVAADFDRSGSVDLFVTNDVMVNFLFVSRQPPGALPVYEELGVLSGLAFDREGRTQASMGIACGDVDGDGMTDLLVANYYDDSNTLHLQQPGLCFSDETREAGLRDPSFLLLSFGSQFLDADLDGWLDLVIANGHVDDFRFKGHPWHMRPQFYRNEGAGRFVELTGERAGDYFQKEYLGRGLARLDWNRDGRQEFAVSNIGALASVTENRTETDHHWIGFQLRGVQSNRDAVGTRIALQSADRIRIAELYGGDGFQATNQRQLIFGLGSQAKVDQMTVTWPGGLVQTFRDLAVDREWILIEGRPTAHPLPLDR